MNSIEELPWTTNRFGVTKAEIQIRDTEWTVLRCHDETFTIYGTNKFGATRCIELMNENEVIHFLKAVS